MAAFLAISSLIPVIASAEIKQLQNVETDAEDSSAECTVICTIPYEFTETIPKQPEAEGSVSGYKDVYDWNPHKMDSSSMTDEGENQYKTDEVNYPPKKPDFSGSDKNTVYHEAVNGSQEVAAGKQDDSVSTADMKKKIDYFMDNLISLYEGKDGTGLSVLAKDCTILYSADGVNYSPKKPEFSGSGGYVLYYKIIKEDCEIAAGRCTMTVHPIDVDVFTGSCVILYSADGVNYSPKKPDFKDSDGYILYYKVMDGGYEVITGECTMTVTQDASGSGSDGAYNDSETQAEGESNILLYGMLLAASVLGFAGLKSRKEKEKP